MPEVNRRDFLKQAGLATAGLALQGGRALAQANRGEPVTASPNEKVLVGIIGVGRQGRLNARGFASSNAGAEVVAICDVDRGYTEDVAKNVAELQPRPPRLEQDFRRLLDDKDIDALVISTPDHWHAIMTIMGCEAGKDIYVEKPACYNIEEGQAMVRAARRYNRIVQVGSQQRSGTHYMDAVEYIRSGKLGTIGLVRAWVLTNRSNIGNPPDCDPPEGVDYDLWLGPAPLRPFNTNRLHYRWHWFWDYGTGEIGNWGAHNIDVALWALDLGLPKKVTATGGIRVLKDARETPDTMVVTYEYPDLTLIWEHTQWSRRTLEGKAFGTAFYGSEGTLVIDRAGWEVIRKSRKEESLKSGGSSLHPAHIANFIECVRTRNRPNHDIAPGTLTAAHCHFGNISLRTGRSLYINRREQRCIADYEANTYLSRSYRKPWHL